MLAQLMRLIRHRLVDEGNVRRLIGSDGLRRIESRVAASEATHTGQIRVCIEAGLPWSYLRRGASVRERALTLFGKLRVWDTEHNNGVLIYVMLAERAIEIVADRALARQVPSESFQRMTVHMTDQFQSGKFADGIIKAIDEVDAALVAHFPLAAGQRSVNELPNAPYLT